MTVYCEVKIVFTLETKQGSLAQIVITLWTINL